MAPIKKNSNLKSSGQTKEPEEGKGIDFSQIRQEGDLDHINSEDVINSKKGDIHIVGDPSKLNQHIPEAQHAAQTINIDPEYIEPEPEPGSGGPKKQGPGNDFIEEEFNQEFHEMPEDEQDESSLQTAIALVSVYAGVKLTVPKMIAVSERRLKKMHKAGEINMYMRLPRNMGTTETIAINEYVENFNKEMFPAFETTQEFKDKVTPLLARILKKNGVGLTDTQLLVFYVAQDLAVTIQRAAIAFGQRREMLDVLREIAQNMPQQRPAPPPPPPPAQSNGFTAGPVPAQTAPAESTVVEKPNETIDKIIIKHNPLAEGKKGRGRPPKKVV